MVKFTFIKNTISCFLGMIFCGFVAVYFGRELCWDLAHYHFYTPYAFLHHRYQLDFWPNSYIHQFINPAIDLLTYGLITHLSPYRAVFILGALHGINLWLLYTIARHLIKETYIRSTSLLLALLGLYGPTTLPGIGSFQNDNLICVFVLSFFLLTIHYLQQQNLSTIKQRIILSTGGILIGLGIGLKLTAAIYLVAAIFATPFLPLTNKHRLQWLGILLVSASIGIIMTGGYWMIKMWQQHHNPVFPYFNNIFHSPDVAALSWRDTRFLPKNTLQTLFYPFYFSFDGRTADAPFKDIRFLILYVLLIPTVIFSFRKPISPILRWIIAFTIVSYIVWQTMFSIARYLAPIEMLTPIIIYLLIFHWFKNVYVRSSLLIVIFTLMLMVYSNIPMIRARWYDHSFFNVQMPKEIKTLPPATVLIAYTAYVQDLNPRPQSYLIPFFPQNWQFIGMPFWSRQFLNDDNVLSRVKKIAENRERPIFLLTTTWDMPELYRAVQQIGLLPAGKCSPIKSDRQKLTHLDVILCPVRMQV